MLISDLVDGRNPAEQPLGQRWTSFLFSERAQISARSVLTLLASSQDEEDCGHYRSSDEDGYKG
jgi:hypothetical protein